MQDSLIDQGINLMLFGMGTVFVFLTILVFATSIMSKLVNRFAPEKPTIDKTVDNSSAKRSPTEQQPSGQILEAIKQAIAQHRSR